MIIEVESDLKITDINVEEKDKLIKYLKANLEIDNPEFYKLEKLGKYTGKTERRLILYQRLQNGFLLPFGALQDIYNLFKDDSNADFDLKIKYKDKIDFKSNIKPYDYQEEAIQKILKRKNGVLVAPCGAGKTEMALETIARIGKSTLWLTHTGELLKQSKERAEKLFDLPKSAFGTITAGKINIGSHITFATVQTLSKIDLEKLKDQWGTIVVDECHRVGGTPTQLMMFYKCLSKLSARHKIGVTATPKKSNGLEKSMFSLLGKLIYEIPKETVASKLCPVEIFPLPTNYKPVISDITKTDGTIDYMKCIDDLCKNEERNNFINCVIDSIAKKNQSCIILSERVSHLEYLNNLRKDSMILTSKSKNRDEIINWFKNGKIKILFATYQMLAEGFDYKDLDCLVLATPQKNERIITQSCGRVARKSDKKQIGTIYDLVDDFGLYQGMWKARQRIYKKNDYQVFNFI